MWGSHYIIATTDKNTTILGYFEHYWSLLVNYLQGSENKFSTPITRLLFFLFSSEFFLNKYFIQELIAEGVYIVHKNHYFPLPFTIHSHHSPISLSFAFPLPSFSHFLINFF